MCCIIVVLRKRELLALLSFSLVCIVCAIRGSLFILPLGIIARLCSTIVACQGHVKAG